MSTAHTGIIAILLLQLGCIAHFDRGTLKAVSTKALPLSMKIIREKVEGESCFFTALFGYDGAYRAAVEDALRKAPDANALVNSSYTSKPFCVVAHGTAVRVE